MATLALHLHEPPQPFNKAAPDKDIPVALERIVLKALEKRPEMRYQDVLAILADFHKYEQAGII